MGSVFFYPAAFSADLVIRDAHIYTVDEFQTTAEALAIEGGEFIFVGSNSDVEEFIDSNTQVISLDGDFVMPGFIDNHNHVFEGASEVGGFCLLSPNRKLHKQKRELKQCQMEIESPGEWVMGYGHQLDASWRPDSDPSPRQTLDKWFPDNPVIIMEESSHSMFVNSLALDLANINLDPTNPPGGVIMRDDQGVPNGVLFDNAGDIIMELAWNSFEDVFDQSYEGLLAGMEEAARYGITTIGDGRLYWRRGWYDVWLEALANNDLLVRTSLRPWIYPEIDIKEQIEFLQSITLNQDQNLLVSNQVKMYIDGVMHFGTGKMLKPYISSWQSNLPLGLNYIDPAILPDVLKKLAEIGYGAHIHAIGDGGVREVLDAIETVRQDDVQQSYGLTHLELIHPDDIKRFKELSVDADFQAGATFFDDNSWARYYIGSERSKRLMPMRQLYNTGANITFSSDWTVNSINPLAAIANSMRLKDSKGLPNIHAAIKAATINAAQALGLAHITGSIEVGKSADFVVLNRDITREKYRSIESSEVLMTVLQGEFTYKAE